MQLIPTATTFLHESAMEAHSNIESPLTALIPSFEAKENQAGISIPSSSRSSAYACITYKQGIFSQNQQIHIHIEDKLQMRVQWGMMPKEYELIQ